MRTSSQELHAISAIIKKRFPNLSVEEVIDLVAQILDAIREPEK